MNEKAIRTLKDLREFYSRAERIKNSKWKEDVIQSLDAAISMLKQEPCEDTISRQAVNTLVDELARAISDERCCISRGRSTGTIMGDILHLPPVSPVRLKGEWIEHFDESGMWYECDQCHTDWGGPVNYCPCCGANMAESGDKE